jgi:hypothetical protein
MGMREHIRTPGARRLAPAALAVLSCILCTSVAHAQSRPAGEEAGGPWWMQQTAMTRNGKLDLKSKPWWSRAAALKVGEQFTIDLDRQDAGPTQNSTAGQEATRLSSPMSSGAHDKQMLVRREALKRGGRQFDAIVWIIDDDADGSAASGGDKDSDCYVVDYNVDGTVDRMVDFIDNDGDNDADEMDIRYFENGELRSVWCDIDLDDDNHMWDLEAYEYSGDFFKSDPYGNEMIYMNKFDPTRGEWVPISECPFAFYDTDGDGQSEITVRVSASPLAFDPNTDPDYANDAGRYRGQWSRDMQRMGMSNIRYSFDVDNLSGKQFPLHYDCGFNLVGKVPYDVPGMQHANALRRPPQVTVVAPHDKLLAACDSYPASETGFSWHEHHDDTIAIGDAPDPKLDFRWEGVFWIWERRFMENTGGPNQKWNVRREWSRKPSKTREVYYSEVDGRLHLFGAEEGWIQIGHFAGLGEIGELRMYDTDGNGFFDRWEVWLGDSPVPARVTTVRNDTAKRMSWDYAEICKFYEKTALPAAMDANRKLAAAMSAVRAFKPADGLAKATSEGSPTEQRYAQDVALELQYQDLRQFFTKKAHTVLQQAKMNDIRALTAEQRKSSANSQTAWQMVRLLEKLDVAYGQGNVDEALKLLRDIGETEKLFK